MFSVRWMGQPFSLQWRQCQMCQPFVLVEPALVFGVAPIQAARSPSGQRWVPSLPSSVGKVPKWKQAFHRPSI
ncbi:hypothetical protein FGO68_gene10846 [Halteria grandinella]|uniref:Uncharacterized protein n=1 Tax=Halteria grandinella TaxID=5974 RepID=A0A8J8NV26_HALGN|nr:hypothetical protein FGO68_gene10846 [Halteria grandinella]